VAQQDGGGCIAVRGANLTIDLAEVSGCKYTNQQYRVGATGGGAVEAHGDLVVFRSAFIQNDAVNANGGAILARANADIGRTSFDGNRTFTQGHGAHLAVLDFDAELVVTQSLFADGVAVGHGGGIWSRAITFTLAESEIFDNVATVGGAVWAVAPREQAGAPMFERSLFLQNTGSAAGGALVLVGHDSSVPAFQDIVITDSTFSQNATGSSSDTIEVPNSGRAYTLRVQRSTFYENTSGTDRSVVRLPGSGSNITFEYVGSILGGQCRGDAQTSLGGNVIDSGAPFVCEDDIGDTLTSPITLSALGKLSGEPTRYHNITLFTPAHGSATCPACTVDQRNKARPTGTCDAGAIER
jgi:hypothetical protein